MHNELFMGHPNILEEKMSEFLPIAVMVPGT